MHIHFAPQRRDDALKLTKSGDRLKIGSDWLDFSALPEGGIVPADVVPHEMIVGEVTRIDGHVIVTVVLPVGPAPSPATAFPEPLLDVADGPVAIPADPIEEGA